MDEKLEKVLPNFLFQTKIDEVGKYIEKTLQPLTKFNHWLDSNGLGSWSKMGASFGHAIIMRGSFAAMGLMWGGMSFEALKAAIQEENGSRFKAMKENIKEQEMLTKRHSFKTTNSL